MSKAQNLIATALCTTLPVIFILFSISLKCQPPQFKVYSYVESYAKEAVHQMTVYKIPASVILAQAIFESSCGTSELAKRSNNHFGIKCHVGWIGDTITKDDDTLNECFRKYNNIEESYTDHSVFLASRPRYASLFKIAIADYKNWCRALKTAGYATYPFYAEELINIIEKNKLYELDGPEVLVSGLFLSRQIAEIKISPYNDEKFSLKDFSKSGLLWLDEKDIIVQSLDLIIDSEDLLDEVAEN